MALLKTNWPAQPQAELQELPAGTLISVIPGGTPYLVGVRDDREIPVYGLEDGVKYMPKNALRVFPLPKGMTLTLTQEWEPKRKQGR